MIVYKVVERQTRHCSNWTLFKDHLFRCGPAYYETLYRQGFEFKRKNPSYFPRYFKGKVIKAVPNSSGILCFNSRRNAERFQAEYPVLRKNTIIIKVKGIGEPLRPEQIRLIAGCGGYFLTEINCHILERQSMSPPSGTISFETVEVLT